MEKTRGKRKDKAKPESKQQYCYEYPRPSVTVDIILFRRRTSGTEVLLIKRGAEPFKGRWALPGGFINQDESLEDAAARELLEETGMMVTDLEQIGSFGDPGRDPRGHTISVAFVAQFDEAQEAKGADDAQDARWHSAQRPPRLAFDHKKILRAGLEHALGEKPPRSRLNARKNRQA